MNRFYPLPLSRSRRLFLRRCSLALASAFLLNCAGSRPPIASSSRGPVLVVGAGIAGITAAQVLHSQGIEVLVLEARDRIGGRIWTDRSLGIPLDLGAAWVHGINGNPIAALARQAGAKTFVTDDDSIIVGDTNGRAIAEAILTRTEEKYENLLSLVSELAARQNRDFSVAEAIQHLDENALTDALMQYYLSSSLEFDTGCPLERLSAKTWDNDEAFPGPEVLFPEGYEAIAHFLARGLEIKTGQVIREITYNGERVTLSSENQTFVGQRAIVTLPLGVLKQGSVSFVPPLPPPLQRAIAKVGMGNVNKVILRFPEPFWDASVQYFGYTPAVRGRYPYFLNARTFSNANILVTFALGAMADAIETQSDAEIERDVLAALKTQFGSKVSSPDGLRVTRWGSDPFASGSYSYSAVGVTPTDFQSLGRAVANRLFFAGEHTSLNYRATVHGAYLSGLRAARDILAL